MEAYNIGYAIGSFLPFLFAAGGGILLVYLLIKRSKEKNKERFDDRDN